MLWAGSSGPRNIHWFGVLFVVCLFRVFFTSCWACSICCECCGTSPFSIAGLSPCPAPGRRMRSLLKAIQRAMSLSLWVPRRAPLSLSCARRGQLPPQPPPLLLDPNQGSPQLPELHLQAGRCWFSGGQWDAALPSLPVSRGDKHLCPSCLMLASTWRGGDPVQQGPRGALLMLRDPVQTQLAFPSCPLVTWGQGPCCS